MNDTIILIPVRLKATRFPNKPFAKIANLPMLHYVYNAASKFFSDIHLAICDQEVENYCILNNLPYVFTSPNHISGTDRIGEAIRKLEKSSNFEFIINLQGDMPFIKKEYIEALREKLSSFEMSTLACPFEDNKEAENPSKVKVKIKNDKNFIAVDFSRVVKDQNNLNQTVFHHIGVYGYQKQFLKNYIQKKPSKRELKEKLEQLRVLEDTKISVTIIDQDILGVDTKEDLDKVNELIRDYD